MKKRKKNEMELKKFRLSRITNIVDGTYVYLTVSVAHAEKNVPRGYFLI